MQLGGNPNPTRYHDIICGIIQHNKDFEYIQQVFELILDDKNEHNFENKCNWNESINASISYLVALVGLITIMIKKVQFLEYLCLKSDQYNTSSNMDFNNDDNVYHKRGIYMVPLWRIMQAKKSKNIDNCEQKDTKESKTRLQFAECIMVHDGDPNNQSLQIIESLITLKIIHVK